MQVIPERLVELSQVCLDASQSVSDADADAASRTSIDGAAAGNSEAGPELVAAHQRTAGEADVALGRLASVLEHHMDALQLCAFEFSSTDEEQAATYESHLGLGDLVGNLVGR